VADLADPNFTLSQLDYLPIGQAQAGDIIVWYGNGTRHSALYLGNNQVIYQHAQLGLKMNTVQGTTNALHFKGNPVVRRYRY
jgi:cell wall-associated NlpC family hydrolase